jgi:glutathione peroxidase
MFSKVEVNGEGAAPLYKWLTTAAPNDDGSADIQWNFTKFLVGRDGEVIERLAPTVTPEDLAERLPSLL